MWPFIYGVTYQRGCTKRRGYIGEMVIDWHGCAHSPSLAQPSIIKPHSNAQSKRWSTVLCPIIKINATESDFVESQTF